MSYQKAIHDNPNNYYYLHNSNDSTSWPRFDNVAREWRCKWSADDDKASLNAAQQALEDVLADLSSAAVNRAFID